MVCTCCIFFRNLLYYKYRHYYVKEYAGDRKQERQARLWGYNRSIGLLGLIRVYENGCKDKYEIAEYLEGCINCYRDKYGEYKIIGNYTIYFIPYLAVFKKI